METVAPPTERSTPKPDGERRGLILVHTGHGKGRSESKSTAALGLALRAHGRGKQVKIHQFMKVPSARFGEHRVFEQWGVPIEGLGDGFSWKCPDLEHSAQLPPRPALALAAPQLWRAPPAQARLTPSPNGGWPMVALALRLGVRLRVWLRVWLRKPGMYALNASAAAPDAEVMALGLRHRAWRAWGAAWLAAMPVAVRP